MNPRAIQALRSKLAADQPVYGLWISLDSASVAEIAVALGLDWIVIDAEHGHLDWRDIIGHIRAGVRSRTVVLVRLQENSQALIKRALDLGADGVVIPWIETADQLRQAVSSAHYPPEGTRGIGAERATGWGRALAQHVAESNEHVLVIPIIETATAGQNIEEIATVPGVEIILLGPADYSASFGFAGQWEGPGVAESLLEIKETIRRLGKQCGIVATDDDNLELRRGQGFRFLGLGFDTGLLLRSLASSLARAGRAPRIAPDLSQPASEIDRGEG
jgi:2-dehydro-3-deoxyglucarate aldolase/4-hydroxy-2-oxoheptanedioate aldolase